MARRARYDEQPTLEAFWVDPDPLPLEPVPSPSSPILDVPETAPPQARPQRTAQPATLFDIEADDTPPPLSRELQDALAYRDPALVKQRAQHEREDEQQQRTRRGAKPAATVADSAGITTPEPDVFSFSSQDDLAPATPKARIDANLAALRTLRSIQAEQRAATPAEQAVLARWSSWGATGVAQVFDEDRPQYEAIRAELRELLPEAEYDAARRTMLNAHYTDNSIVQAMWQAVQDLGFTGGTVLEPGCGSGTFIGAAPPSAQMTGVELDPTTAAIAQALYPTATVRPESFADTRYPAGHFDLAIGNVPFGDIVLHDPATTRSVSRSTTTSSSSRWN